ncbi:hypothetical protein ACJX0J_023969, partial [Zea mays]
SMVQYPGLFLEIVNTIAPFVWYFFCLMYSRILSTFEGALYLLAGKYMWKMRSATTSDNMEAVVLGLGVMSLFRVYYIIASYANFYHVIGIFSWHA